ncbi:chemerin-like receptor 1 [Ambystoma mexicanum]|uniref:chemerin-like receptor 1 n=1 Tax=Ambystoma mexicanum TaxID=8296 RepID=UPI0037E86E61
MDNISSFPMNSTALASLSPEVSTFLDLSADSANSSQSSEYSTFQPFSINFTDLEQYTTTYTEYYDYEYEQEVDDDTMRALHVFSMFIYTVAFLLGVTGNGLVIWITGFKMKTTVNTVWFINLAIADFIFTFFLPLSVAYIALGFHWPFGTFLCKLNSTMAFFNMFSSIFFLMVISIDRCICVVMPVWSQNHRKPSIAIFIAIGVWFCAFVVSLPYFFFRTTGVTEPNGTIINCYNNYGFSIYDDSDALFHQFLNRYQATISARFVIGFLLPFLVIVFCYAFIVFRLNRNHLATSSKPFKIITAVIVCFFLCWLPYHILSFLEFSFYAKRMPPGRWLSIGVPITSSLAFLNSCVNPILYVFVGQDFRAKFRTSILAVFEHAFTDEATQTTSDLTTKSKSTTMGESQIA